MKGGQHVSVVAYVYLLMYKCVCLHTCVTEFVYAWLCVFVYAAWWVGVVGTARAIYSSCLT